MGGAHFSQHHPLVGGDQTGLVQRGAQALKEVRDDYDGWAERLMRATHARTVQRRQHRTHRRAGPLVHLHLAHQHGGLPAHEPLCPAGTIRGAPQRRSGGVYLCVCLPVSARTFYFAWHCHRDHCDGHRHDVAAVCKRILGECAPCSRGRLTSLGRLYPARHRAGLCAHGAVGIRVRRRAYMRIRTALCVWLGAYRHTA